MAIVGLALLLVYPLARPVMYPLAPAEWIPGYSHSLEPTHPFVVYVSAIGGALLVTWGVFAVRHRAVAPLTVRRALLAPVLGLFAIGAGVAVFTYEWIHGLPIGWWTAEAPLEFHASQVVHAELGVPQFGALAAVLAMVVGTVAARHGWHRAVVWALLPVTLIVGPTIWYETSLGVSLVVLAVFLGGPIAFGYGIAKSG
ncbi:hypothetical protein B2G88_13120 [Natronolimnobius baerhuensis]|uniref:Uncharacterized protein n=1 Tax=Natronolimnobius baerhuensis TaxID=253108 RepID=A0A202E561_9EURY|nr:hypothetical protein B2G88_13120 [Natronolimnobius baerhuensis]